MSSMRFNMRRDKSHYTLTHAYKDAGVVADILTGIHNKFVKCLFVVNRSCTRKGVQVSPQVKSRGLKSGEPQS
jgi:hypothetical protein